MGRLDKYARQQKRAIRNQTVSTKLNEDEYRRFIDYVEERNLGKSEALYLLILEEIGITPNIDATETNKDNKAIKIMKGKPKESSIEQKVIKRKQIRTAGNQSSQAQYLAQFKIDKKLPCPVCQEWSSANHFAGRHAKKHGYQSTYEFLKAHEETVQSMYNDQMESIHGGNE